MLCLLLSLIISRIEANTNNYSISGRISDERTGSPLPGASILIKGTYLWAVSDQKGEFTIQGIQEGKYQLEVSFLGYVPATVPVNVNNSIKGLKIQLKENTLALNDVIVTAQAPKSELNTTLNIGSNALEHLQISNVSDISALLPGGKTKVPDLTSNNIFSLRDGGSSAGNAAFGTAIEVDGVRIGNNSSFGNMTGIDPRSISVADIESVEVITGVPSAEYGDLNSGMVKIHTKKGKTPWNVLLSINPRTEQVSFSKGLDLGNDKGIVNISGEWIKATQKLNSPYTSYTRRGFSAGYSNTFRKVLRFDIGLTGNIGGMNTKDDPDAYTGEYTKVRDNVFRANTSLAWLLNKSWITNLKLDASVYYNDNKSHAMQQLPDYEDYSMKGRTYRFMTETPLYPFGYGLSYTRFSYGKATLNQSKLTKGEKAILTIPVSNVGQRDGEEVVQVYICRPDDKEGPQKTLRGFQRVSIAKGKTQNVQIELPYDSFEWFDAATNTIRPLNGTYKILYGNSSNEKDLQTCSIQIQ